MRSNLIIFNKSVLKGVFRSFNSIGIFKTYTRNTSKCRDLSRNDKNGLFYTERTQR